MSLDWIHDALSQLTARDLLRDRRVRATAMGVELSIDGRQYINFGSNDYLGFASDPSILREIELAVAKSGWGSGASPLIVGRSAAHAQLESALAEFLGKEGAILFPSGFAANAGTIPALVGMGDVIFSDAKNHASIIDGCRLSRAKIVVYPHGDVGALRPLVAEHRGHGKALLVSDSLFSMDGDVAPLTALATLAKDSNIMFMVDEAHAIGALGPQGKGLAHELGVIDAVDVFVGTLSKALGSHGGFVAAAQHVTDYLANRARSYVFSTAGPAAASISALAALDALKNSSSRQHKLEKNAFYLREELAGRNWNIGPACHHVIPLVVGDTHSAISLSEHCRSAGYWVPCIRPPTVPAGEECLRISLSSSHTKSMIDGLLAAIDTFDR